MSEHRAELHWQRNGADFGAGRYSRNHELRFDGGAVLAGSASPSIVPPPGSDPGAVDPEELFVAALSSCHMLWFLHLAAEAGFIVDDYRDDASGRMGANARKQLAIVEVRLRPAVRWTGEAPDAERLTNLHHEAHKRCFLANSVACSVHCEPVP